jgi:hypothetical protein
MMHRTVFCSSDSPPANPNMKPGWYAENIMNAPTCSPGRPLLLAGMNDRFRNPLLAAVYPPTPRTMHNGGAVYPSICFKPIPLAAVISSALDQSAKVFVDDSPATKSCSLRNTIKYRKSSSSTMTRVISPQRKNKSEARVLPINFSPHPYSVICGRGVRTDTPGNRYLQSIAVRYMMMYSQQAHSKTEKSSIVSHILEMVRGVCPDGRGAFIRTENNRWIELNELDAREKISSVMRNGLDSKYRSSTKSKVAKRKYQKALNEESRVEDGPLSPEMAFSEDLCSKYEPADHSNTYDDEVFDLLVLGGEDLSMERFFE